MLLHRMRWSLPKIFCLFSFVCSCLLVFSASNTFYHIKKSQSWDQVVKKSANDLNRNAQSFLKDLMEDSEEQTGIRSEPREILNTTIFLYRAYLNQIGNETTLRIFSLTRCHTNTTRISALLGSTVIPLTLTPLESRCPWAWSGGCKYNAYVYDGVVPEDTEHEDIVTVNHETLELEATMDLNKVVRLKDGKLTVCVPPLYWYTDWTKLILFLEYWGRQGASHFIIYYHSATENVKVALDHYVKKGIVTLVHWPLIPSNDKVDPNKSVYRLSHTLSHNDCAQRITSEYGSLVDIDEFIMIKNSTLLEYVHARMSERDNLGSLSFTHRVLMYDPPITPPDFNFDRLDFKGVMNANIIPDKLGPRKVVFRAAAVLRLSTHWVLRFTKDRKWRAPWITSKTAYLLHNRFNFLGKSMANNTRIDLLPRDEMDGFRRSLVEKKKEIFPEGADFHPATQSALGSCLARWRWTQANCKVPVTGCHSTMLPLENWTHTHEEVYTLL